MFDSQSPGIRASEKSSLSFGSETRFMAEGRLTIRTTVSEVIIGERESYEAALGFNMSQEIGTSVATWLPRHARRKRCR